MLKVLKATYRDGDLILQEKLGSEWEGKTVNVVIEIQDFNESKDQQTRVEQFLEKWQQHPGTEMTEDYKFDRDEIYDR